MEKDIKDLKISIVGVGMVGGALKEYFEGKPNEIFLYDKGRKLGSPEEVNKGDVIFICVPTPFIKGQGFDLSYVKETCEYLEDGKIVVIKSTVVPGSTQKLQEQYPKLKFLFNPEFLTEVTADQDMNYPDRQIIGYTKESHNVAGTVMLLLPLAPYEKTMPSTEAELVKYYGNNWFSVKVTFANQFFDLCDKIGANYDEIMEAASADKRIGRTHLTVWHKGYRGFGGKCLVKDIRAMIEFGDKHGMDMKLLKIVEKINNDLMEQQGIDDPETFSKRD